MRSSYSERKNYKVIIYVILLALIVGIGVVVLQDIKVPSDHISQEVPVKVEK